MALKRKNGQGGHLGNQSRLTRRQFIKGSAAGAAAVYLAPSIVLGSGNGTKPSGSKVVRVIHPHLITPDETINPTYAGQAVNQALLQLFDEKQPADAWQRVFPHLKSEDTIGIKVNCINRKCPTHPEITYALAQSLIDALDIDPNRIIIWDRTTAELKQAGYTVNTSKKGIRCFGTVDDFSIARWFLKVKQDESHAVGYDKRQSYDIGADDDAHLSNILTRMCTHLINMPVLKDHRTAGITLSLKNHYGTIDNPWKCHSDYCDPFIARLNKLSPIRKKTRLIVCDAAFCVYDGGPRGAPKWRPKAVLAATDPVALDYTGMVMINGRRQKNDLEPVTDMAVHLKTAQALGLGTCDPERIELKQVVLN